MNETAERAKIYTLSDLADTLAAEHAAADKALAEGRNLGPSIKFPRLANEMLGYWPPGVTGLHATPGAGKSAFGIECVLSADCPAIYLTSEMSATTVLRRMIACETGEFMGNLARGKISASGISAKAAALATKHPQVGIIAANTAPCPADLLRSVCERMRTHDRHMLLAVDSLHAWASAIAPEAEEYQAISAGMEALRRLAADLNVSVLAIIERNRASMKDGGLSAGASSRKIEYSAEAILELQYVAEGRVNLRFAKNRNGRAGVTIGYTFDGATQRFNEVGDSWPTGRVPKSNGRSAHLDEEPEELLA